MSTRIFVTDPHPPKKFRYSLYLLAASASEIVTFAELKEGGQRALKLPVFYAESRAW
jgi:hypothetical protein